MQRTVLIADARAARRRKLHTLLSSLRYRVFCAATGAEALEAAASERPQLVLLGGGLPDWTIERLAAAFRRRCRGIAMVMLLDRPEEIEALRPLAAGFILRSFSPDLIALTVANALELADLRRRRRARPRQIARRAETAFSRRLETERFLTVKQIVDKLSTFIGQIARDVEGGVRYYNEIPFFVAIHDRQGRVLAANRSFRALLGGQIGDPSCRAYEGPSGAPEQCPVGRTIRSANAQESREVLRYRSGARVPVIVHTAPIYNNDGEVELVLEVSAGTQDMTQLRDALHNTQQRYQLLFDAVPCFVASLDRSLVFSAGNRLFVEEFGEKTGVAFRDVFSIDEEDFSASPVSRTLADGMPHHGEMALIGPNGRHYNLLVWSAPMSTPAGKLMQVLLIFLDITQIRELQSNLASLGLMIGSISHSIKGVLTGLDAGVYLLTKGFSKHDDAQIQSGLEIVRSVAERIRKMVLDILLCAKERELQYERVDIRAFAEDLVQSVKPVFSGKNVDLACDFESNLGEFEVDAGMLRSALINLLENAADACAVEGCAKPCRTVFHIEANAEVVGILVEDNGIGMNPEQVKNLFTVFFSTKGSKGTGLGLFITDKIIRRHGGSITVDSAVGRGSRFGIMIPRRAERAGG